MQENKYKEAISFYEPLVQRDYDSGDLLKIPAIVLANLCVSYIMTNQNEDAEELMRRIEREEEQELAVDPTKPCYHLICIINLVIGTLYCAKGNFEFRIGRVMNSMDPMSRKLGTDTWYYASRCFCALFETMAKQMILLKDDVYKEIISFLDSCDKHGRSIPAASSTAASVAAASTGASLVRGASSSSQNNIFANDNDCEFGSTMADVSNSLAAT
jgi:tetratricopeptide repeat protein 30